MATLAATLVQQPGFIDFAVKSIAALAIILFFIIGCVITYTAIQFKPDVNPDPEKEKENKVKRDAYNGGLAAGITFICTSVLAAIIWSGIAIGEFIDEKTLQKDNARARALNKIDKDTSLSPQEKQRKKDLILFPDGVPSDTKEIKSLQKETTDTIKSLTKKKKIGTKNKNKNE